MGLTSIIIIEPPVTIQNNKSAFLFRRTFLRIEYILYKNTNSIFFYIMTWLFNYFGISNINRFFFHNFFRKNNLIVIQQISDDWKYISVSQ